MPFNRADYPENWLQVRHQVMGRAGGQCEFIYPSGNRCEARDWQPHPRTGSMVVLSCCHLDHDKSHADPERLAAFCQLHHNRHDADIHAADLDEYRRQQRTAKEAAQLEAGQQMFDL